MEVVAINVYADDNLFPYVTGDMLGDKATVRVIKGARTEEMSLPGTSDKTTKLVLVFHGTGKKLILNKTNVKRIIKLYGPNTDAWRDQPIELHAESVRAFGAVHNSVRVGERKPQMPADIAKKLEPVSDEVAQAVLD